MEQSSTVQSCRLFWGAFRVVNVQHRTFSLIFDDEELSGILNSTFNYVCPACDLDSLKPLKIKEKDGGGISKISLNHKLQKKNVFSP